MKPTSDVATAEAGTSLLAPGNGQVFADVTSLKDGSDTELHLYYVEGAKDFYVPTPDMGLIFVVYTDPTVAADDEAYDEWNIWTFNNGTGGSVDGVDFEIDIELTSGAYTIPMKLAVLEVSDSADLDTGFIVRTEDWAKQCANDIMIDNSDIRGSGSLFYFYQSGSCDLETDYDAYLTDVAMKFEMNSGNRFMDGTIISGPTVLDVNLLMPKNPAAYDLSRFKLLDANGTMIPIANVEGNIDVNIGAFTSSVTCATGENYFVLYVDTSFDHSKLAVVGGFGGTINWNIDDAVASVTDDANGNAVIEICAANAMSEFKLLYDEDGVFEWSTPTVELTPANQSFDMSDGNAGIYYISVEDVIAEDITPTVNLVGDVEKYVVVYVDTTNDHDYVGLVGSFNGWNIDSLTMMTQDDEYGYAVFEFIADSDSPEFKVMYDDEEDGSFQWDPDDVALTSGNIAVDLTDIDKITYFIDSSGNASIIPEGTSVTEVTAGDYTYTSAGVCGAGENKLTLFVNTPNNHDYIGAVGTINSWNIGGSLTPIDDTTEGYAVIQICITDATGEFKIMYDDEEDGTFEWDPADVALTNGNQAFDFDGATELALLIEGTDMTVGTFTAGITPVNQVLRLVRIYVDTDKDHAKLGIVGTLNGWDIDNPIMVLTDDANGLAYFEVASETEDIVFKVLFDPEGDGFGWDDTTEEITPADQEFTIDGTEINLFVSGDTAREFNLEHQFYPATQTELLTVSVTITFSLLNELMYGTDYTVEYLDKVTEVEWVASEVLEIDVSDVFTAPSPVEGNGTYAILPTEIQVVFDRSIDLMNNLVLVNQVGQELLVQSYEFANSIGDYTTDTTCEAGNNLLFIHVNITDTIIDDITKLGIVGTVNGWDIDNTIPAVGMDANGYYVFEVCLADTETAGEFKVKYDPDGDGFTWVSSTDPELTPGNVAFTVADGPHFLVEEGASELNVSRTHVIVLPDWQPLDITNTYRLQFEDENGFLVYVDIDLDTEAPVIDFSIIPNIEFVIDETGTLDLLDFYTKIQFLDNREGEMEYEFVTNIDLDTLGVQTITIKATDMWMNETTFDIVLTVVDTTAPVITVDSAKTYEFGAEEPDWSSFASTNEGTIVIDDSQVDMDAEGIFYVNYTAEDTSGNSTTVGLEVTIGANPVETTTGCGSAITLGSSLIALIALGGAILFFVRKP